MHIKNENKDKEKEVFFMKKKIFIVILIILSTGIMSLAAAPALIQAYLVNYYIDPFGEKLSYPLISYNDNTYMAVRDVASLLNKNVEWFDDDKEILFMSRKKEDNIIKEPETALAIGKAIISEYYKDKVNENSSYRIDYGEYDDVYHDNSWMVSVVFNPEEEIDDEYVLLNADVRVEINSMTCNFRIIEKSPEGSYTTMLDFKLFL